jgi:hypothetical protein
LFAHMQGKSFILNQLLGRSGGFVVAPTHRPCTKGGSCCGWTHLLSVAICSKMTSPAGLQRCPAMYAFACDKAHFTTATQLLHLGLPYREAHHSPLVAAFISAAACLQGCGCGRRQWNGAALTAVSTAWYCWTLKA